MKDDKNIESFRLYLQLLTKKNDDKFWGFTKRIQILLTALDWTLKVDEKTIEEARKSLQLQLDSCISHEQCGVCGSARLHKFVFDFAVGKMSAPKGMVLLEGVIL